MHNNNTPAPILYIHNYFIIAPVVNLHIFKILNCHRLGAHLLREKTNVLDNLSSWKKSWPRPNYNKRVVIKAITNQHAPHLIYSKRLCINRF